MSFHTSPTMPNHTLFGDRRKYFVVDYENLLGTDRSNAGVALVWDRLKRLHREGDQILVATGPKLAKTAMFLLKDAPVRYFIRSGVNGADDELLFRADEQHAASRFDMFVICSGDSAFTDMAQRAAAAGMPTWLVSGRGDVSRRLHAATRIHTRLHLPYAADSTGQRLAA